MIKDQSKGDYQRILSSKPSRQMIVISLLVRQFIQCDQICYHRGSFHSMGFTGSLRIAPGDDLLFIFIDFWHVFVDLKPRKTVEQGILSFVCSLFSSFRFKRKVQSTKYRWRKIFLCPTLVLFQSDLYYYLLTLFQSYFARKYFHVSNNWG